MTATPITGEPLVRPANPDALNTIPSLKEVIKSLPAEYFEKRPLKAWGAVLITLIAVGIGYSAIAIAPWFLLPIAWIFTGTALTGCFVLAHDCGHRSFAKRRWVNDWVGHILMMPLIYPFHSWRILHNQHHTHTNKTDLDNAWHPFHPEFYDSLNVWSRWGYQGLRGRFWWVASIVHWAGLHFDLSQFAAKDRNKVKLSIGVVVGFGAIAFPLLLLTIGVWGVVKFWLLPWLIFHFWMSTFTLVHHTDPDIEFAEAEQWDAAQAQLYGTVHCSYPRWVEFLCHDINVHVPHHISTAIPFYNLRKAHTTLQQRWDEYMQPERQFSWALMKRITDQCHLYEIERGYQSFKQYHSTKQ